MSSVADFVKHATQIISMLECTLMAYDCKVFFYCEKNPSTPPISTVISVNAEISAIRENFVIGYVRV